MRWPGLDRVPACGPAAWRAVQPGRARPGGLGVVPHRSAPSSGWSGSGSRRVPAGPDRVRARVPVAAHRVPARLWSPASGPHRARAEFRLPRIGFPPGSARRASGPRGAPVAAHGARARLRLQRTSGPSPAPVGSHRAPSASGSSRKAPSAPAGIRRRCAGAVTRRPPESETDGPPGHLAAVPANGTGPPERRGRPRGERFSGGPSRPPPRTTAPPHGRGPAAARRSPRRPRRAATG